MLYVVTVVVLLALASPWVDYGDHRRALRTAYDDAEPARHTITFEPTYTADAPPTCVVWPPDVVVEILDAEAP